MTAVNERLFPGKHFISTVLEALETKQQMSGRMAQRYLQRAAMAGIIIGFMYVTNFTVVATFAELKLGDSSLAGIGRLVGGAVFGFALVFIYYTKSELLTSNMMIVSIGAYHRGTTWRRALQLLGLCFLGNFLGGLLVAVLLRFSTLTDGGVGTAMDAALAHKLEYVAHGPTGWGDLFVRAILCNLLINLAMLLVYNGLIKDDLTKSLAMIVSVFIFAFDGFEHSVANTVLFTITAIKHGVDLGLAVGNVAIALLGNYVGGGVLIGLFYAYVNDDRKPDRERTTAEPPA